MDVYERALNLLATREHSEKELRAKLIQKGCSEKETEDALTSLKEEGALSDERFAESFIRSRLRRTPEGKSILLFRLKEKGVPDEIARSSLEKAWEEELYITALRKEKEKLEKKYPIDKVRLKLMQKGFTLRDIQRTEE